MARIDPEKPRRSKSSKDAPGASGDAGGTRANGTANSVRRDLVADAILEEAAQIFASRGVQGTGIREIAEAMNMSRPAVYHYFSSKEELLEHLLDGYTGQLTGFFREIRNDANRTPSEKLREMVSGLAMRVAAKPAYLRLVSNNEPDLPERLAKAHNEARHEVFEHMTAVISEGIETGELRPVDERIVAFALFGMCHWIAWWYRPGGPASDQHIAEEMTNMALSGLMRPEPRRGGASGIQHAIQLLREDLEYLERLAGTSR